MLSFNRHNSHSGTASSPPRTRWWNLAGSTTALGAFVGAAQAEIVQITLTGNQISNSLGNTLEIDLTGDGNDDFKSTFTGLRSQPDGYSVRLDVDTWNDFRFSVVAKNSTNSFFAIILGTTSIFETSYGGVRDASALIPIQFTDARINAGSETSGLLEVRARNLSNTDHQISLLRVVFDDESTDQPIDAMVGGTKPEWVAPVVIDEVNDTTAAQISTIQRTIKKLTRSFRKAKRKGNRTATLRIRKKIKKLRASLRAL